MREEKDMRRGSTPPIARPPGEQIERFVWRANAEGNQRIGSAQESLPLTAELFNLHVRPKLRQDTDLRVWQSQNPDDTHITHITRGDGRELWGPTGSLETLRPQAEWCKQVDSFDSSEARQWRGMSDARAAKLKAKAAQAALQPWQMTREMFRKRHYCQHNVLRPDAKEIGPEGFKSYGSINVIPATEGPPWNVIDATYGTKAGRPVYVVPNEWVHDADNGPRIKNGWVPGPDDKVVPSYDYQPLHEVIVETAVKKGRPVPREVVEEYSDKPWAQEYIACHEGEPVTLEQRYRRAKAALAEADSFYKSELFWKAFEEGGIDEFQVAKVERMAKAYELQWSKNELPRRAEDPIGELLDRYELGEIETVQDLADEAEVLAVEADNALLMDAIRGFREWQKEDWELAGRGDWDEAEATLIAGMRRASKASPCE